MIFLKIPIKIEENRKVIHVDMDAFFASVEEREHPEYKKKCLIVAQDPRKHHHHGVVTTANYNARKYGAHSAMPAQQAVDLIPKEKLVITPPNFELYRNVSNQIHDIFADVTDNYQSVALDEAYLDVTKNKLNETNTIKIANYIQQRIVKETNLTCSVGISYNKFLAKMASDYRKPFGRTIILGKYAKEFLKPIPIEKFNGIGKAMQEKLHEMDIYTGEDLQNLDQDTFLQKFGKMGYVIYKRVHGIDDSPVEGHRLRKSIGRERTYNRNLVTEEQIYQELDFLAELVSQDLRKKRQHGKTVVLKLRNSDFETITKRMSFQDYVQTKSEIYRVAKDIYDKLKVTDQKIRLLGITVTNLDPLSYEEVSLNLSYKEDKYE
ncbi:DNA polymerase IV [Companilactobacillus pabuli]|uniref:DNA polymerase IV n=2 Tax=Companilactobacillus pabuli TaxID=2714036 RepID=A0A7L7KZZ8_9LACO|nr:DNA polymerase IV [Companilactobacillus pabuli]AKP02312.1 DNA polymerase IV [Companilactobacillus farciminis]AKS50608.1 DNA polymerase IV [Companilactobacillus farciminis]MDG5113712.1 DNA polymerase IV [Companilactobacillus pabuli]QMT85357.1 DNA polymerase IV [Companilactobacillus pabuli]